MIKRKHQLSNVELSNKEAILDKVHSKSAFSLSQNISKKRKRNPTSDTLSERSKVTRCSETLKAASVIHGATNDNKECALTGFYETITRKFPAKNVDNVILNRKEKITSNLKEMVLKDWSKSYKKSEENILRSLNVFYSHDVMGKEKYINVCKANRQSTKGSTQICTNIFYPP